MGGGELEDVEGIENLLPAKELVRINNNWNRYCDEYVNKAELDLTVEAPLRNYHEVTRLLKEAELPIGEIQRRRFGTQPGYVYEGREEVLADKIIRPKNLDVDEEEIETPAHLRVDYTLIVRSAGLGRGSERIILDAYGEHSKIMDLLKVVEGYIDVAMERYQKKVLEREANSLMPR